MSISRRDALKNLLVGTVAAGVAKAPVAEAKAPVIPPLRVEDPRHSYPDTQTTEDFYRAEFNAVRGDPNDRGFAYHCVNCQGNCAFEVWTDKSGKVSRENQSALYPQISPNVPDANPRGCNKGAQHSQVMYEADRLLFPMRRVGERGAGNWKRISWDEAITDIATHLHDGLVEKGPASNYIHIGAGVLTEARAASIKRLGSLLGAVRPYIASYVGDMFPGVSVVFGEGNIGCTYDFVFQTNVAIFWGCNPNTSRIPDAHYLWEGKYNGSKIIVITPEFNSTAIHADLWVPVKAGYDGHLALSIIQRIIARKLYKPEFLKEYTDLPLLVRTDTKELVRLSDLDPKSTQLDTRLAEEFAKPDHTHDCFLAFNTKTKKFTVMPGSEGSTVETLRLQDSDWDIDPALNGRWTLTFKDGKKVKVTTAFELFKNEVQAFAPEKVKKLTGVHPSIVDELADRPDQAEGEPAHHGLRDGQALQRHALAAGHRLAGGLLGAARAARRHEHRERVEHHRAGGALGLRGQVQPPLRLGLRQRVRARRRHEATPTALYSDEDIQRGTGDSQGRLPGQGRDAAREGQERRRLQRGQAVLDHGARTSCSSPTRGFGGTRATTRRPSSRRRSSSPTATCA